MIKFHAECMQCLLISAIDKAASVQDHALRARYIREVCRILSQVDTEHDSAPIADSQIVRLRRELLHIHDDYSDVKRTFNELLLSMQDRLPDHVRSVLNGADVIIAKGQGNFETLLDTDLNVYFMLLAKCEYYKPWFGLDRFSCVLANANRMRAKMGI